MLFSLLIPKPTTTSGFNSMSISVLIDSLLPSSLIEPESMRLLVFSEETYLVKRLNKMFIFAMNLAFALPHWYVQEWIAQSLETTPNEQQQDSMKLQQLDEVVKKVKAKVLLKLSTPKAELEITGSRGREGAVLGVFARGGRGRQVLIIVDGVQPVHYMAPMQRQPVISITTKNATQQGTTLSVQSSMGTNQTVEDQNFNASDFSNSVQLDGMANKFSYAARFSHTNSRGLSAIRTDQNEEDVFSRFSTELRLGYQFSENFKVAVYGNQTKLASDFDESFGLIDADYSYLNKQERLGLSSTFNYGDSGTIVLNAAQTSFNSESKSAFPNTFEGKNLVVDVYNKLRFNTQWYTVLGLNYIKDETEFLANQTFEIIDPYVNVVYVSDFGLNSKHRCSIK
ncbi:hypothetical protein GQR58_023078 [Nymphon striatum]|nr:hypothetical protein GQR58_023078 [Nymphon striatum]